LAGFAGKIFLCRFLTFICEKIFILLTKFQNGQDTERGFFAELLQFGKTGFSDSGGRRLYLSFPIRIILPAL